MFSGLIIIVDLEGVEPSSKQGSHMLSTCLSLPSVFVHKQDQLKFHFSRGTRPKLFPNLLHR